jgi:leucyl aminopeptidase
MDILFSESAADQRQAPALLVFTTQTTEPLAALAADSMPDWLAAHPALRDFTAAKNQTVILHGPAESHIQRIIAVGLGKPEKMDAQRMRHAAATGVRSCRGLKLESCAVALENLTTIGDALSPEQLCEEIIYGSLLGLYAYDQLKTKDKDPQPQELTIFTPASPTQAMQDAALRGEAAARGVMLARDLSNGPANIVTPSHLAATAQELAEHYGFSTIAFGRDEIAAMGMGGLESVARGAEEEPKFIVLEHAPEGTEDHKPIIFVGKGITFDTGGISLKPSANLHELKDDMAGAAAVLGLFEALGRTGYERRVIGIMPCTENMPDGRAYRPGDVVTTMSGKTVEIISTDAEGRMALCDALTWAQREYDAEAIFDLATLTGACVVALGHEVGGVFTKDEALSRQVCETGQAAGDRFWPLPMWDLYFEGLKSDVADMKNSGVRPGAASSAAQFLDQFIEDGTRHAHLDIAGPASGAQKTPVYDGGATGFAVRTLLELVRTGVAKQ